jgi:hypothetical protein
MKKRGKKAKRSKGEKGLAISAFFFFSPFRLFPFSPSPEAATELPRHRTAQAGLTTLPDLKHRVHTWM